jgi:hypothetical protein
MVPISPDRDAGDKPTAPSRDDRGLPCEKTPTHIASQADPHKRRCRRLADTGTQLSFNAEGPLRRPSVKLSVIPEGVGPVKSGV